MNENAWRYFELFRDALVVGRNFWDCNDPVGLAVILEYLFKDSCGCCDVLIVTQCNTISSIVCLQKLFWKSFP